ncbi:hypothetical protein HK102_010771 [Quaeritorhiza haematococci]|nr:hypothetical protein HK102_010771 [Quaeritorhiza haematococci]
MPHVSEPSDTTHQTSETTQYTYRDPLADEDLVDYEEEETTEEDSQEVSAAQDKGKQSAVPVDEASDATAQDQGQQPAAVPRLPGPDEDVGELGTPKFDATLTALEYHTGYTPVPEPTPVSLDRTPYTNDLGFLPDATPQEETRQQQQLAPRSQPQYKHTPISFDTLPESGLKVQRNFKPRRLSDRLGPKVNQQDFGSTSSDQRTPRQTPRPHAKFRARRPTQASTSRPSHAAPQPTHPPAEKKKPRAKPKDRRRKRTAAQKQQETALAHLPQFAPPAQPAPPGTIPLSPPGVVPPPPLPQRFIASRHPIPPPPPSHFYSTNPHFNLSFQTGANVSIHHHYSGGHNQPPGPIGGFLC